MVQIVSTNIDESQLSSIKRDLEQQSKKIRGIIVWDYHKKHEKNQMGFPLLEELNPAAYFLLSSDYISYSSIQLQNNK